MAARFDREDDSPEQLYPSEPIFDLYPSDDELAGKHCLVKKEKISRSDGKGKDFPLCSASVSSCPSFGVELRAAFNSSRVERNDKKIKDNASAKLSQVVSDCLRPSYVKHKPDFDFTKAGNPTLAECLEELLDFALEENPDRRTLNFEGKKLFDGKTTDEIIQFWTRRRPKLKWILENFSQDIVKETKSIEKISEDIQIRCVDEDRKCLKSKEEEFDREDLKEDCVQFVCDFLELLNTGGDRDRNICESSSQSDHLHDDKFKPVVPLIASFLGIFHLGIGQCNLKMHISEVTEKNRMFQADHLVIAKPDLVLKSLDEVLTFPVQVYAPLAIPNKKDVDVPGDNEYISRTDEGSRKFKTEHLVQHIGLLRKKLEKITFSETPTLDLDKPCISVGMFLTGRIIHFSKVKTTIQHMSSFTKPLVHLLPSFYSKVIAKSWSWCSYSDKRNEEMHKFMLDNVQENGLLVIKSQWYIDLCKGVHRNALFIFLLHYFRGYVYFVKNKKVNQ